MNLAKVSSNGQITIPIEVRRNLGLKSGDKILFLENDRGEYSISNASATALKQAQKDFEGVAESLGIYSDEDVQELVNEVRYKKGHKK